MKNVRDMLNGFKKERLLELAKAYGIKGCSKDRKEVLINKIIEHLLFPTVMYHRLSVLDDREIALFKKMFHEDLVIGLENLRLIPSLVKTFYTSTAEDGTLSLLPGVKESFGRFNHDKFEANRKKVNWLLKCLECSSILYGVIPIDLLLDIYNQKPKMRISKEELLRLFHQIPNEMNPNILMEDIIIGSTLDNEEDAKCLLGEQQDKSFYIPTHRQVEFYSEFGFFEEPGSGYNKIRSYLNKKIGNSFFTVNKILENIFQCSYMEEDVQEIIDSVGGIVEFKDESEVYEFLNLINEAHNDTRMIVNRGHTPNEMAFQLKGLSERVVNIENYRKKKVNSDNDWFQEEESKEHKPVVRQNMKIYPNNQCPCGSNKKYKKCCSRR